MDVNLAKKTTVVELVAVFQRAAETIRTTYAALNETQAQLDATFNLNGYCTAKVTVHGVYQRETGFRAEAAVLYLQRQAWKYVVERMEVRSAMSALRVKALNEQLERGELPELTVENVYAFVVSYTEDMEAIFAEQVREVFDALRPRGGTKPARLKTNRMDVIGDKVILHGAFEFLYRGRASVRDRSSTDMLRSLENIFSSLDGKGNINRRYRSLLQDTIEASPNHEGETEYFRFKLYKNGNLHLQFLRPDLLAEVNRIAGGKNFTP